METTQKRLSKTLAAAGVASRRACEELIFDGKVKVNGEIVRVPQTLVDGKRDRITVYGKRVCKPETKVYYILHKPRGFICSNKQLGKSPLVVELFKGKRHRLFTVGRLDKETSGLLIITNDGHFANRVMHPSHNVHKEYLVKTDCEITEAHLKKIGEGVVIDGTHVKPVRVKKVRRATVKVTVAEGKKWEVRHLIQGAGLEVLELIRTRIGGLHLGNLPVGNWRPMTEGDLTAVFE